MGLKGRLAGLQKAMRDTADSFELENNGRFWFEPEKARIELYRFWCDSLRAEHRGNPRPEPPEVLEKVARAKDRRKALEAVYPPPPVVPWIPVDVEALVERGEFVPRPLVVPRRRGGPETDSS